MQETRPRRAQRIVAPSRNDSFLAKITELVGGPLGKRTEPGQISAGFFSVERVLVLLVLLSAVLALLFKDHCRQLGWTTPDQYSTTCYSEIPNAFSTFNLAQVFPFSSADSGFSYPPLVGLIAGINAWLSGFAGSGKVQVLAFFDLNAILSVLIWIAGTVALARSNRRRPWDAAIFAASPLLLFAVFSSWDLWAAALGAVGLFLFSRRRTMAAGIVLGLAICAQPYTVLVVLAIILVLIRRRLTVQLANLLVGTALSWLVFNLPLLLLNPAGWSAYWAKGWNGDPATGSIYYAINAIAQRLGLSAFSPLDASVIALVLLVLGIIAVAWLCFSARYTPRVAHLALLLVGWFLLVDKHASAEHLIWLLPLFALARPRWRSLLIWQVFGILFYLAQLLHLGVILGDNNSQHSIDLPYFVLAMLASGTATLILLAFSVRDLLRPEHDPIRRVCADDPLLDAFSRQGVQK